MKDACRTIFKHLFGDFSSIRRSGNGEISFWRELFDYRVWPGRTRRLFVFNVLFGFFLLMVLELLPLTRFGQDVVNENHDFLIAESFKQNAIKGQAVHEDIELVLMDRTFYESSSSMGYWTPKLRLNETLRRIIEGGAKVVLIDCRLDRPVPDNRENMDFLAAFKETLELARSGQAVIIIPRLTKDKSGPVNDYSAAFWKLAGQYGDVLKVGDAGIIRNPEDKRIRHLRFYRIYEEGGKRQVRLSVALLAALYAHGSVEGDNSVRRISESIMQLEKGSSDSSRIEIFKDAWITFFRQEKGSDDIESRLKFTLVPKDIYARKLKMVKENLITQVRTANGIKYARPDSFRHKVVVIGSDYKDIGDMHLTRVGRMPGVYIITNAVSMFMNGEQVHVNFGINYFIKFITVILVSFGVAHLPAIFDLLLLFMAFVAFRPLSAYLFIEYGLFFNFLLLIAGISFFDYVNNVGEYLIERFSSKEE